MFWGISGHHGGVLGWHFRPFRGGLFGRLGTFRNNCSGLFGGILMAMFGGLSSSGAAFWGTLGYYRAVFHNDILRSFGVF